MKKPDEALKQAELTLEKYRKNKTQIPPEDLEYMKRLLRGGKE